MTALNFSQPLHYSDIEKNPGKSAGVYIWGFMYYYNKLELTAPVDYSYTPITYDKEKMIFIPYYVGKHQSSVLDRLREHRRVRQGHALKYTRLSPEYMTQFFMDEDLPIHIENARFKKELKTFIRNYPGTISYFNNDEILKALYGNHITLEKEHPNKSNWPIDCQLVNNEELPDPLWNLAYKKNNFWCCYAQVDKAREAENINVFNSEESYFEALETFTFWSLNGKTISKVGPCPAAAAYSPFDIKAQPGSRYLFKNSPTDTFPGYLTAHQQSYYCRKAAQESIEGVQLV